MVSVFFIFFIELLAFRWGTARLKKLSGGDVHYDAHGHAHGPEGLHAAHGPEPEQQQQEATSRPSTGDVKVHPPSSASHTQSPLKPTRSPSTVDLESNSPHHHHSHTGNILDDHPLAQVLSVLILEFGIIFHSFITGITLAVSLEVVVLLIVLTFHQLFEGLGLGTRLAHLTLFTANNDHDHNDHHDDEKKKKSLYRFFPWFGALAFALTTPLGVAVGLGLRNAYDPESTTESIVSGIFDSFSSGILLYTGLVELLAHEFLFSKTMRERPTGEVAYAGACVLLGAGLMALLGRWA
jgi:solute carrier family 39 (zinc transporter), member 1/2/3